MKIYTPKASSGFSVVEIAIIVPMLMIIALFLFSAAFDLIKSSTNARTDVDLNYEAQTALKNIESDVLLASLFLPSDDATLPDDPYSPGGNPWSYTGTGATSRVLIARTYGTTGNPLSASKTPVYIGNPAGAACTPALIYFNDVTRYNVVYFVKNNVLFRRKIVTPDTGTNFCTPQYQVLSCPSLEDLATEGIVSRNSACNADDEILAKNVTNFTVDYYASTTSTTPLDVYAGGADPNLVTTALSATVTVTVSRTSYGKSLSSTAKIKITKLNANL